MASSNVSTDLKIHDENIQLSQCNDDDDDNLFDDCFNFTSSSWGDMMEEEEAWNDDQQATNNQVKEKRHSSLRVLRPSKENILVKTRHSSMRDTRSQKRLSFPRETDPKRLRNRQRQVDIGKNTEGYKCYLKDVKRRERTKDHPWTPDKSLACSTRSWQGIVRVWRRKLHFWDPEHVIKARQESFFSILPSTYDEKDFPPILNQSFANKSVDIDDDMSSVSSSGVGDC